MHDILSILALVAVYLVLTQVVLPKLGIKG